MDTRIATPLFELVLPGAWSRSTPEPGIAVFRSPSGAEQLSISSVKVREPIADADQPGKLRTFVRVRREAESRVAPQARVSDATYFDVPRWAAFTAEDTSRSRRSATFVLVRETAFVVVYLESIAGNPALFDDLTIRLSAACAGPPNAAQ